MKIEVFYAEGCGNCSEQRLALKEAVQTGFSTVVHWNELDIVKNIEQAVELGVLTVPAIAIDGTLVFAKLPSAAQLVAELNSRVKRT